MREELCGIPEVSKRCRILKEFKLKPYMPRLLQSLNEDDLTIVFSSAKPGITFF